MVGVPESAVVVDQMIELRDRDFMPETGGADKGPTIPRGVAGLRAQKIVLHLVRKDCQKPLQVLLPSARAIRQ